MNLDAMFQAIVASPDDDDLRRVYADALVEQGDPLGEFIHVQLERAELDEDDANQGRLRHREGRLRKPHQEAWTRGIPKGVMCTFRRGFLDGIETSVWVFLEHLDTITKAAPLLREVKLEAYHSVPKLLAKTLPPSVRSLSVRGRLESDYENLLRSTWLGQLEELCLWFSEVGDEGAQAFAATPELKNLKALHLCEAGITEVGARALAASEHLRLNRFVAWRNPIGPTGAASLFESPVLAAATRLEVGEWGLMPEGLKALAQSPIVGQLEELDLRSNRLNTQAVVDFIDQTKLGQLKSFGVKSNRLMAPIAEAIAETPHELVDLDLNATRIGDDGTVALAKSTHLTTVRALNLRSVQMTSVGAEALARSKALPALRSLNLNNNDIKAKAVAALDTSKNLQRVRIEVGRKSLMPGRNQRQAAAKKKAAKKKAR